MKQYLDLLREVLEHGARKNDRTGTGTLSLFARQLRCDLSDGFPALTTKKIWMKGVVHELLWFLRGETNIAYLQKNGVRIWDKWADEHGELGHTYGYQWRYWTAFDEQRIDQIRDVVEAIRTDPDSRRLVVSAWNVAELPHMALPPCHVLFQFYVENGRLSCQVYQRSADIFLGLPFNIASYALLTHMVAKVCSLGVGELIFALGDVHLYQNHVKQARIQLSRPPCGLPTLFLERLAGDIDSFLYEDIHLFNYCAAPAISAPVAI